MTQTPNPLAILLAAGVLAVAVIAASVLMLGRAQAATAEPMGYEPAVSERACASSQRAQSVDGALRCGRR